MRWESVSVMIVVNMTCTQLMHNIMKIVEKFCSKKVNKFRDEAFYKLTQKMKKDISKSWTSVELYKKYMKMNGCISSRKTLIEKVKEKFSDKLVVLSSPGFGGIIIFQEAASKKLKI